MFVDCLVVEHGLAEVLRADDAALYLLHAYIIDRRVSVREQLLEAAAAAGVIRPGLDAPELLRGVGISALGRGNGSGNDRKGG